MQVIFKAAKRGIAHSDKWSTPNDGYASWQTRKCQLQQPSTTVLALLRQVNAPCNNSVYTFSPMTSISAVWLRAKSRADAVASAASHRLLQAAAAPMLDRHSVTSKAGPRVA